MTPRISTEDYVRPTTAARIAGVHRSRIDQLLTAGELASVEIDGHRFIRRRRRAVAGRGRRQAGGVRGAPPRRDGSPRASPVSGSGRG